MKVKQTFRKQERLKSSKMIRVLFTSGNAFLAHPFRVNWIMTDEKRQYPGRILVSVSKKNFRKANERNHIKRLVREAYRKNKYILIDFLEEQSLSCDFSFVYIGKTTMEYSQLEKKIIILLKRLVSELEVHIHQNI